VRKMRKAQLHIQPAADEVTALVLILLLLLFLLLLVKRRLARGRMKNFPGAKPMIYKFKTITPAIY
jgi:hypothetical protein